MVNNAVQHAGGAVDAEIFDKSDFARFPVKRVGWACLYAELAFDPFAGLLVNLDAAFFKELFHVYGFEKPFSSSLFSSFGRE